MGVMEGFFKRVPGATLKTKLLALLGDKDSDRQDRRAGSRQRLRETMRRI
jgi:hypothetical protein